MTTFLSISKRLARLAGLILACLLALSRPLSAGATPPMSPAGPLVISEILPNAVNESTGELFEIVNTGPSTIDLAGWKFADASGVQQGLVPFNKPQPFGVASTTILPNQVALVLDKDYAGEYNTEILQSDTSGSVVLLTTSSGNMSLANSADSVAVLDTTGTVVDSFTWSADPGSEVPFARELKVDGPTELAIASTRSLGWVESIEVPEPTEAPKIELSELLPNPATGEEFIELHSVDQKEVDLSVLSLKDASGKLSPLSGLLSPGSFVALYKSTTAIALNNDGDTIELLWTGGDGSVLDTTTFESSEPDMSWSHIDGAFAWTTEATPGEANFLVLPANPDPEPEEPSDTEDQDESSEEEPADDVVAVSSLVELQTLPEDTEVQVQGVISSPRGLFYKDTLHIVDSTGAALVHLDTGRYSVGTRLTINGTTQQYAKQIRIEANDVQTDGEARVPYVQVAPGELTDEQVGLPVEMRGSVVGTSAKSFRLGDKTTNTLVSIRKSTGISKKAPKKGSQVSVQGIVLRSGEQLVVAPRSSADIVAGAKITKARLAETGAGLATLAQVCVGAALALSGAWLAVRQALCRAESWGRSRSSRDRGAR